MRDLLFKTEDFIFSYRVAGLLRHEDKILLQRYKDDYTAIGGHVLGLETHKEALKREFKEELDMNIGVDDLVAVGENFFTWDATPWHQICFYYHVHMEGENSFPMEGIVHGQDEWEDGTFDLDFCWVPVNDLEKIHVIPKEVVPIILKNGGDIVHFVSKE
ncbi:MAG: NUDIX domain-containing protein [Lachnospiraceae bacterium]|nr:NUDIX domain-containing protein [Lachnospiraceae bacterium]